MREVQGQPGQGGLVPRGDRGAVQDDRRRRGRFPLAGVTADQPDPVGAHADRGVAEQPARPQVLAPEIGPVPAAQVHVAQVAGHHLEVDVPLAHISVRKV